MKMNKTLTIIIFSLLTTSAVADCDVLFEKSKGILYFYAQDTKRNFEDIGDNSEATKKYHNAIDKYVSLYNSKYRSNEIHLNIDKEIKKASDSHKSFYIEKKSELKYYNESIKESFMKLAKLKYTKSFYCLGRIHEQGIGVDINYSKAWAWYNTAFAVEGMKAKQHLERVWHHLNWETELEALKYSDKYTYLYTNITSTPSTTILR